MHIVRDEAKALSPTRARHHEQSPSNQNPAAPLGDVARGTIPPPVWEDRWVVPYDLGLT
jgi:hypothetical protein